MNYIETLNYIHSLGNFSLPAGLERIKLALQALGNPQNSLKAVHIAGTNGKGSVSAFVSSVFKAAGYKTGLFISPFVVDFRERIQINGEFISEEDLVYFGERVKQTNIRLTEFEFITAVAFLYFKEKNIDILICETGLGGRLDATNTLENPVCCVITKIGLDHTAVLGDTLEQITEEKCGILRDCPTVTTPFQPPAALNIIKARARELVVPDLKDLKALSVGVGKNEFIYSGKAFETALFGEYQLENAIVAIEAVKASGYGIPYEIMYEGLNTAAFPARLEVISQNPLTVLDGAHNPDGGAALSAFMEAYSGKITAIIGMMGDKAADGVLALTLKHCKGAVAVSVPNMPRSLTAQELCRRAEKYVPCEAAADLKSAIARAREIAKGEPIFIFGSLYLAGSIRPLLKK